MKVSKVIALFCLTLVLYSVVSVQKTLIQTEDVTCISRGVKVEHVNRGDNSRTYVKLTCYNPDYTQIGYWDDQHFTSVLEYSHVAEWLISPDCRYIVYWLS